MKIRRATPPPISSPIPTAHTVSGTSRLKITPPPTPPVTAQPVSGGPGLYQVTLGAEGFGDEADDGVTSVTGNLSIKSAVAGPSGSDPNTSSWFEATSQQDAVNQAIDGAIIVDYIDGVTDTNVFGDSEYKITGLSGNADGTIFTGTILMDTDRLEGGYDWDDLNWAVTIKKAAIDLEVDSNNDGTIDPATDGPIKDNPNLPGKVIPVDDISPDGSGIPGYADGYSLPALGGTGQTATGLTFAPMLVTVSGISSLSSLNNFDLELDYSESDPTQVQTSPFSPAPGMLRIWSQDGSVARNDASLANGGNLIPSGSLLPLSDFTWNASANDSMTATLYVEAVSPSKAEGDIIVEVSLFPINSFSSAGSDEVRLTALRTKQSWTNQALSDAGITQAQWASQAAGSPSGFTAAQQQVVQKVYALYQSLYQHDPGQFLWAGLAKVAGGAVYNGLMDAQTGFVQPWLNSPLTATGPQTAAYTMATAEIPTFLQMQQAIFDDLAWQHEAYLRVGLFAITLLPDVDPNTQLNSAALTAWTQIDSGDAAQIKLGNNALFLREQQAILQPIYNNFQWPETNLLGEFTEALFPAPQGQTFTQVEGNFADITNFQTRWDWILKAVLPIWNPATQAQRTAWVQAPLGTLAHN